MVDATVIVRNLKPPKACSRYTTQSRPFTRDFLPGLLRLRQDLQSKLTLRHVYITSLFASAETLTNLDIAICVFIMAELRSTPLSSKLILRQKPIKGLKWGNTRKGICMQSSKHLYPAVHGGSFILLDSQAPLFSALSEGYNPLLLYKRSWP